MSLPHLLLGLLKDAPLSGYDLYKATQTTIHLFWTCDQSQIYRALYRMTEAGWLAVEVIHQTDNPDKKLYHLTEAGQQALHAWLVTPLEEGPPREAWLGQIFFGDALPTDEILSLLRLYEDYLQAQIAEFTALSDNFRRLPPNGAPPRWFFRLATLDYGLARHRFELDWITRLREQIEQRIRQ